MEENQDPNKKRSLSGSPKGRKKSKITKTSTQEMTEKQKKFVERHSESMDKKSRKMQDRFDSCSGGSLRCWEERLSEIYSRRILANNWEKAMLELAGLCNGSESDEFMGLSDGCRAYELGRVIGAFWVTIAENIELSEYIKNIAISFGKQMNSVGDECTRYPDVLKDGKEAVLDDEDFGFADGGEEDFVLESTVHRYNKSNRIYDYKPKKNGRQEPCFIGIFHNLKKDEEVPQWFHTNRFSDDH